MSVTFSLLETYKNEVTFQDVGIEMCLEYAAQFLIDGVSFSYTGSFSVNDETEYDAMTWTDVRTKPTWTMLTTTYFNSWKQLYRNQNFKYGTMQDVMNSIINPAIDGKSNQSSLNTTNSNLSSLTITVASKSNTSDVNTALGLKADASALTSHTSDTSNPHAVSADQVGLGNCNNTSDANKPLSTAAVTEFAKYMFGAGYLAKEFTGTTDANGEVVLHLTHDGTSGGNALFNTSDVPYIGVTAFANTSDPLVVPHAAGKVWSNGNKTVTIKVTKGTSTSVLIGGTVNSAQVAASVTVDLVAIGLKA